MSSVYCCACSMRTYLHGAAFGLRGRFRKNNKLFHEQQMTPGSLLQTPPSPRSRTQPQHSCPRSLPCYQTLPPPPWSSQPGPFSPAQQWNVTIWNKTLKSPKTIQFLQSSVKSGWNLPAHSQMFRKVKEGGKGTQFHMTLFLRKPSTFSPSQLKTKAVIK